MAFPGTYNISYYKGDTLEFVVYPKLADGSAYDLTDYTVKFSFSTARGSAGTSNYHEAYAIISSAKDSIKCAIRPAEGNQLVAGTEYVYDVEVKKPAGASGSGQYEVVQTLLTGKITITDQVTGATSATSGA